MTNISADLSIHRKLKQNIFKCFSSLCVLFALFVLLFLIISSFYQGWSYLSWDFLNRYPSRFPDRAGLKAALYGSAWVIGFTGVITLVVGIGTAVFLEELTARNKFSRILEVCIVNLAGVPSIIYGILGLAVFARGFNFERSILTAALTLALMILPVVTISAREALKAVPKSIRLAAFSLGASRWQTAAAHVLPAATPGILTGFILSLSRAMGEAAPLILVGGLVYVTYVPSNIFDGFTVLPIQIFNWASRPQEEFQNLAAAGVVVLLALLLILNSFVIAIRTRFEAKQRW